MFIKNGNLLYGYISKLKLALIPYWIFNIFVNLPFMIIWTLISFIAVPVIGLFIIPSWIFSNYLLLLFTSLGSILFLVHLKKNRLIKMPSFIINIVMQLCFVLDIVSAIYLKIKYKEINDKIV
jgi:hypothetical protein